MTDLSELIERVKKATGPDQELDAEIHSACGLRIERLDDGSAYLVTTDDVEWRRPNSYLLVPKLTGSIDAALALVEKKLPGWFWTISRAIDPSEHEGHSWPGIASQCYIERSDGYHNQKVAAFGATPPLAIITALLRALDASIGKLPIS